MQLNIGSYSIPVDAPYKAGPTVLTLAEATALNVARLGLIKDRAVRAMKKLGNGAETLTGEQYTEWLVLIREMERGFTFTRVIGTNVVRPGTLNAEIRAAAREVVVEMSRQGLLPTKAEVEEAIVLQERNPDVIEVGRKRFEAKQRANAALLDELINGTELG